MTEATTLAELKTSAVVAPNKDAPMSLLTGAGFEQIQRVAKALSSSTMVPVQYRAFTEVKEFGKVTGYLDNPAGLPNCVVALNMAVRMNADPLMIMQNLHVIEGRPSWSSQFIIAMLNSSGKFSPLRFELSEPGEEETLEYQVNVWVKGNKTVEKRTATFRHQSCIAWVIEKETGERLQSPRVTMAMARDEGWIGKNGSKWQTMQEIMLQYRTASLLGRFYAPELLMGLQSREEVEDFIDATPDSDGTYAVDINDLRNREPQPPVVQPEDDAVHAVVTEEHVDKQTGEIKPKAETKKERIAREKAEAEAAKAEAEAEAQYGAKNDAEEHVEQEEFEMPDFD